MRPKHDHKCRQADNNFAIVWRRILHRTECYMPDTMKGLKEVVIDSNTWCNRWVRYFLSDQVVFLAMIPTCDCLKLEHYD
jgi:hypothetical protein